MTVLALLLAAWAGAAEIAVAPEPVIGFAGHAQPVLNLHLAELADAIHGAPDVGKLVEASRGSYMLPQKSPERAAAALILGAAAADPRALSELAAAKLPAAEAAAVLAAAQRVRAGAAQDPQAGRALERTAQEVGWVMEGVPKDRPGPRLRSLEDLERFMKGEYPENGDAAYRTHREHAERAIQDPVSGHVSLAAVLHEADRPGHEASRALALELLDRHVSGPHGRSFEDATRRRQASLGVLFRFGGRPFGDWADEPWAPEMLREVVLRLAAGGTPALDADPWGHQAYVDPLRYYAVLIRNSFGGRADADGVAAGYLLQGAAYLRRAEQANPDRTAAFAGPPVLEALALALKHTRRLPDGFLPRLEAELSQWQPRYVPPELREQLSALRAAPPQTTALVPAPPQRPAVPVLSAPPAPASQRKVLAHATAAAVGLVGGLVAGAAFPVVGLLGMGAGSLALLRMVKLGDSRKAKPRLEGYDLEDMEDVERFLEESRVPPAK